MPAKRNPQIDSKQHQPKSKGNIRTDKPIDTAADNAHQQPKQLSPLLLRSAPKKYTAPPLQRKKDTPPPKTGPVKLDEETEARLQRAIKRAEDNHTTLQLLATIIRRYDKCVCMKPRCEGVIEYGRLCQDVKKAIMSVWPKPTPIPKFSCPIDNCPGRYTDSVYAALAGTIPLDIVCGHINELAAVGLQAAQGEGVIYVKTAHDALRFVVWGAVKQIAANREVAVSLPHKYHPEASIIVTSVGGGIAELGALCGMLIIVFKGQEGQHAKPRKCS